MHPRLLSNRLGPPLPDHKSKITKGVPMADIGEPVRRIELIPADEPVTTPVETPAPVEVPA